jgi:ABC-type transporter MlaC component
MKAANLTVGLTLFFLLADQSNAATISNERQSCILGAMAAGSAALNKPAELNALYERYFDGEKIAQLAAGTYWDQYDDSQKDAQRSRVQHVVVSRLAPSLSQYKGSSVRFVSESGEKVKGVVTASHRERRRITWHFDGSGCRFINVSVDGLGSLISLVGKEPVQK